MIIYFYDGSRAECEKIEFYDGVIIWDGVRKADILEVLRIEAK